MNIDLDPVKVKAGWQKLGWIGWESERSSSVLILQKMENQELLSGEPHKRERFRYLEEWCREKGRDQCVKAPIYYSGKVIDSIFESLLNLIRNICVHVLHTDMRIISRRIKNKCSKNWSLVRSRTESGERWSTGTLLFILSPSGLSIFFLSVHLCRLQNKVIF